MYCGERTMEVLSNKPLFNYKIQVLKHNVRFEAHSIGLEPKKTFTDTLSHVEAPSRIRAIYSKMCESKEEEEFLYQATKMFQAKEITTTLA